MISRERKDAVTPKATWVWILCLSALAVGARNFEQGGIGVDGPLYALMARGIVQTGHWFHLSGTVPHFTPFADHPHLGIWLIGLVFHLFPAADWSARIPGILFYVGFLVIFFRFLRRISNLRTAVAGTLILWSFYRFSNYFSNVCLDPGVLFFGSAALFALHQGLQESKRALCALAGVCLALCAMVKGLAVLGFFPALAFTAFQAWKTERDKQFFLRVFIWFAGVGSCVFLFYLLLVDWRAPGLIQKYWFNQWVNRFATTWDWSSLVKWRFWGSVARDTHYLLLPAVALAIYRRPRGMLWVPWILLASFAALYAPADRVGVHYWVTVLPWVAWAFAQGVPWGTRWTSATVMRATGVLALALLFMAQFVPLRIHGREEGEITWLLNRLKERRISRIVLDQRPKVFDFTQLDKYTWYLNVPIESVAQGQKAVPAHPAMAYVLLEPVPAYQEELKQIGWCKDATASGRAIFLDCQGR